MPDLIFVQLCMHSLMTQTHRPSAIRGQTIISIAFAGIAMMDYWGIALNVELLLSKRNQLFGWAKPKKSSPFAAHCLRRSIHELVFEGIFICRACSFRVCVYNRLRSVFSSTIATSHCRSHFPLP